MSLSITKQISIPENEVEFNAIRAQGAGGQNVNKVSSAIHLRFDIHASSLPGLIKERLLKLSDNRISRDGIIVIKAQRYRDQDKNRHDALQRLRSMVELAVVAQKKRKPTRPTKSSVRRRLDAKNRRAQQKTLRRKVID
ncbi:MAG: alternative ribosome rescue aminoacyl-tRNA hydrolase ArfB [Candidatus Thiodiazotropha sp. 6PLUC2]